MDNLLPPLRVCHVAYSFYESDNRVIRYAEALAARGDHVDVIALRRDGAPRATVSNGVSVLGIQTRARNEESAWLYLLKILWFFAKTFAVLTMRSLRRRYDLVHVHNIPDFLVFVALVPRLLGARVILDIHDLVPELYSGKFGKADTSPLLRALLRVEKLSCRFAHYVIIANHLWLDRVVLRSAQADKCAALLNYPDVDMFRATQNERPLFTDTFVFLYPGSLNYHQGLDLAIDAFADARQAMPGSELHIYGDGASLSQLKRQVQDLGLQECVLFMARVPLSSIQGVLSTASVGIVPKRADGFGNEAFSTKLLEFMVAAVPCIVARTKIDAHYFHQDVVKFFTPGSVSSLSQQMVWAFRNRLELRVMAKAAAEFATKFHWDNHKGTYLSIVDRLVHPRAAAASMARGI